VTPKALADKYGKEKYSKTTTPEKLAKQGYKASPKIDGAAVLLALKDVLEAQSVRQSAGDSPIRHTFRAGLENIRIPEALKGAVLRGEMYGQRDGKVIPLNELSRFLNMTTEHARREAEKTRTKLKVALHGMADAGGTRVPEAELFKRLAELTGGRVHPIEGETTDPLLVKKLVDTIRQGKHPLTKEGVVLSKDGRKVKYVPRDTADVWIKAIKPANTADGSTRAGSIGYSLTPDGPVVGNASGFNRADARDMLENPDSWIGRAAKIQAHSQNPSGAYRSPAFVSRHEDIV